MDDCLASKHNTNVPQIHPICDLTVHMHIYIQSIHYFTCEMTTTSQAIVPPQGTNELIFNCMILLSNDQREVYDWIWWYG